MDGFCFDIEGDALYLQSKRIWYIRFKSLDGSKTLSIHPFKQSKEKTQQQIQDWLDLFEDGCLVVGHNILGYDMWMLWRHLGFAPKVMKNGKDYFGNKRVQYVDTFVLSQYINPDSQSHSLEYLARGSDDEKMDYRAKIVEAGAMVGNEPKGHEFSFYHPLMDSYCNDDVDANIGVGKRLWVKAKEMYKDDWVHTSFKQMQKDYFLYSAQAYTGVKFNVEKAKALIERIDNEMGQIKSEVDPLLPPRSLKTSEEAFYRIPAKPFKKSGELSTIMEKWLIKHNAKLVDGYIHAYGLKVKMGAGKVLPVQLPMEIEDNIELKQYFLDSGWKPHDDFWNFKRGPDNKPMRDEKGKYIKTTPKIQNAGQLCPNLLKLDGEIPKKLVKFLSLRNRKGVVEGWLSNWRIEFDGRLSAEISGYAPTSRVKHRTVVNVPKADPKVLLGCEMRDLFEVPKGYWYCGTDAAALENRTLSHYTFKFDGGKFARMQTEGDPHCYSEDTQILTTEGWKFFGELNSSSEVAQWDDGVVSFVKPSHILWEDYEGEMVSVRSGKLDFLVTPNHRVAYLRYGVKNRKTLVMEARELDNRDSDIRLPLVGNIQQSGLDLSDAIIKFFVAAQADSNDNGIGYRFEFTKDRKIQRFLDIMKEGNIQFSEQNSKRGRRFYVNKKDIPCETSLLTENRVFSKNVLKLSFEQLSIFVNEVKYWDGTVNNKGDVVLDTTDKESRDMVATTCSLIGIKSCCSDYIDKKHQFGIHNIYRCYIPKSSQSLGAGVLGCKINKVMYKGKIGCVSVPSSFVLVKRNNKILVSGNTFNAFAFFPHLHDKFDIDNQENKENPEFKTWRNKAKTGAYLLAFGGGAAKLASSLGLSKQDGQDAYDNYWKMNEGLGKLKEAAEKYYSTKGMNKYIPGIDGRLISVRGKNVLLSCLGQGCGAVAMSYAACFMDRWLGEMYIDELGRPYYLYKGKIVKRISMVHDEYSWEVEDGIENEISNLTVKAIIKAGEFLKLSLPLNGEGKVSFEGSWLHVH